jgi:hypothetical protein
MNMIWLRLDASRALPSQLRGRFGDFAARDDEGVVDEDSFVVFGVEDLVGHEHRSPVARARAAHPAGHQHPI